MLKIFDCLIVGSRCSTSTDPIKDWMRCRLLGWWCRFSWRVFVALLSWVVSWDCFRFRGLSFCSKAVRVLLVQKGDLRRHFRCDCSFWRLFDVLLFLFAASVVFVRCRFSWKRTTLNVPFLQEAKHLGANYQQSMTNIYRKRNLAYTKFPVTAAKSTSDKHDGSCKQE